MEPCQRKKSYVKMLTCLKQNILFHLRNYTQSYYLRYPQTLIWINYPASGIPSGDDFFDSCLVIDVHFDIDSAWRGIRLQIKLDASEKLRSVHGHIIIQFQGT